MAITYSDDPNQIDWAAFKEAMIEGAWDNGRSVAQYEASYKNSYASLYAWVGEQGEQKLVGTVRALSDGICNAYVVDVWTHPSYRRQGIGKQMMKLLLNKLPGQHVYLFTDDQVEFYQTVGFAEQPHGMGQVVGQWLVGDKG